jgi:hypothetical protein
MLLNHLRFAVLQKHTRAPRRVTLEKTQPSTLSPLKRLLFVLAYNSVRMCVSVCVLELGLGGKKMMRLAFYVSPAVWQKTRSVHAHEAEQQRAC